MHILGSRSSKIQPKFNEKTPRETHKERNGGGRGKKRAKFWAVRRKVVQGSPNQQQPQQPQPQPQQRQTQNKWGPKGPAPSPKQGLGKSLGLWGLGTITTTTQQQQYNLGRLRFNRRGASTPLWGVEACSPPSRRPNPIPAIPPYVVRIPHLHGAPTTEETVEL